MEVSMSFWKELSRRNVVKVGIAYAVAAWLIIHPIDIIFPTLHLPEWTITFVTALFIIAFPFVLIFAWIYEVTPKGLKKTKEVPISKSITQITGRRLNYLLAGLLIVAVGLIIFDNFYLDRHASKIEQVPAVTETAKTQKTIAVLPFVNLSSDPEQEYFVDGLSEEILNSLAQMPDLTVIARTSSFTFKGSNKKVQEIANELGVENILEGSVRKAGTALRITAQLVRAVDGSHLWSKTYDRELKDIFTIQEDIAGAVTAGLKATLGVGKSLKQLGGTDNEKAYELYLIAQGQRGVLDLATSKRALESIDAAIALDPRFSLAWVSKSDCHTSLIQLGPKNRAVIEQDAALSAALKAIELEPNLADAYAALGLIRSMRGEFIEAALAYDKAYELITGSSFSNLGNYIGLLQDVGYFKRAHELLEEVIKSDPLNGGYRVGLAESFGYLSDMQRAEEAYELVRAIYGDDCFLCNLHITMARLGSGQAVTSKDILISSPIHDAAKEHLESPKEGLAELRQFYSNTDNLDPGSITSIAFWAAYFGDPEFAMDALEKVVNTDAGAINNYWCPLMKQVRQLPRFNKLVKKIGLVDYWEQLGWPDMCHKLDNGDFECD